jgi:hypothetical protein
LLDQTIWQTNTNGSNAPDTIVLIPLVIDSSNAVQKSLICQIDANSIETRIMDSKEFAKYGYAPIDDENLSAKELTYIFMLLNKQVYGYNEFKFNSLTLAQSIFGANADIDRDFIGIRIDSATGSTTINKLQVNMRFSIQDPPFVTMGGVVVMASYPSIPHHNIPFGTLFGIAFDLGMGTGLGGGSTPIFTLPTFPSGSSGGGGTTSGGTNNPQPQPPIFPFVVYECSYQLTPQEQAIFDEIAAEDAQDQQQNLDCQGTKKGGGAQFRGNKQHWMVQLDYVSKNPLFGEIEYQIPNASLANPNNRGWADIVNKQNGDIFEIKPDNVDGQANGALEVQNYVSKANQNCTGGTIMGAPWRKGAFYAPTILPGFQPNKYLVVTQRGPGVICYEEKVLFNNPNPLPVVIPSSILDKFGYLVQRLRGNVYDANRIIAEFLQQNPDLVTYIKSAAIGAGVAIIVGTILEDILTLGAGIADDWACFGIAYKIIRFAVRLP